MSSALDKKLNLWKVRLQKEVVDEVDELKWDYRASRRCLIDRAARMFVVLSRKRTPSGSRLFEELERQFADELQEVAPGTFG